MRRYPEKGGQFAITWVDLLYGGVNGASSNGAAIADIAGFPDPKKEACKNGNEIPVLEGALRSNLAFWPGRSSWNCGCSPSWMAHWKEGHRTSGPSGWSSML